MSDDSENCRGLEENNAQTWFLPSHLITFSIPRVIFSIKNKSSAGKFSRSEPQFLYTKLIKTISYQISITCIEKKDS